MLTKDIITEIKNKKLPVIICGAGIVGEILLSICEREGIKVDCFCDSSKKVANSKFCGLDVLYTPDLRKKYEDATLIISVVAIKDVVDLLHRIGFENWYAGGLLLRELDISQDKDIATIDYNKFAVENCILCHDGYLHPDKLFMRSIDIIITERCSLKCRDCSNLMQYYEKPKNCDTAMLLKSIDVFCAVIDEVMDFRVLGGEPFMNKDWHIIVKRLTEEPKGKRIVLYTNGTIIPDEKYLQILKKDKVLVIISDYGILSKNLVGLKQIFEHNKISYHVLKITDWLDCSAIKLHNRTIDQKKEIFKNCCAKNMATLSDGKLFRCPYAANAARLSAVPDLKTDYVDLFYELNKGTSISETKNKVKNYLFHKEYMETCDYCNGRPLSAPEVKPAVQADKPLTYLKQVGQNSKEEK